jgi:hypothetical protein
MRVVFFTVYSTVLSRSRNEDVWKAHIFINYCVNCKCANIAVRKAAEKM